MGFRTVIVNSRSKLEFRLNYLVIRGEKEKCILINEINTPMVQAPAVSLTAALLCELVKSKVKVIFCDEKNNPQAELMPYYGAHNTSKRYKTQILWKNETKQAVWQTIVARKIINQAQLLFESGFLAEYELLNEYAGEVLPGDITNREGHAAKVYFNCMLPEGVGRRSGGFINACLNYGYALLLSAFNREIVACGYLTQLGLWHDNEFNQFNFSCDLMEPLRTIVDKAAFALEEGDEQFKRKMANILNYPARVNGKKTTLDIAIRQYVRSVTEALENDEPATIVFPEDVFIYE